MEIKKARELSLIGLNSGLVHQARFSRIYLASPGPGTGWCRAPASWGGETIQIGAISSRITKSGPGVKP